MSSQPSHPMSNAARLKRLEELRRDLRHHEPARRSYTIEALLGQLWIKTGTERLEVSCVLFDVPFPAASTPSPRIIERFHARLATAAGAPQEMLQPPPSLPELMAWAGGALAQTMMSALDALKALITLGKDKQASAIKVEIEVCLDALKLVEIFAIAEIGEACVRVLRLFPPTVLRDAGSVVHDITLLREAACRALGLLSPDALYMLWYSLGSPDPSARRDLLPALDYLRDSRAVPYLLRLLERRAQWPDGEMMAWFIVRALERIGDRSAVPALWRLASAVTLTTDNALLPSGTSQAGTSQELAREAKRVIEALEGKKGQRDRDRLLRPASAPTRDLLQPASPPTTELVIPAEMPNEDAPSLLPRPADPARDQLLRAAHPAMENLLLPAEGVASNAQKDAQELLRMAEEAQKKRGE